MLEYQAQASLGRTNVSSMIEFIEDTAFYGRKSSSTGATTEKKFTETKVSRAEEKANGGELYQTPIPGANVTWDITYPFELCCTGIIHISEPIHIIHMFLCVLCAYPPSYPSMLCNSPRPNDTCRFMISGQPLAPMQSRILPVNLP